MNRVAAAAASPTRTPAPLIQRCACGAARKGHAECEECKAKRVQRLAAGTAGARGAAVPPIVNGVLRAPGHPLEPTTRAFFERRFDRDFSGVRIHTDDAAAQSARAVNALAYTSGDHIVFGAGQYGGGSQRRMRLLAHELTHVVQQKHMPPLGGVSDPGDAAEGEAERNADRLSLSATMSGWSRPSVVSRQAHAGTTGTTVTGPPGPPDCTLDQHHVIEPAVAEAQRWLSRGSTALGAYAAAPADTGTAGTRAALRRHFNSADPAIATRVQGRLDQINTDLTSRDPFTTECHDASDPSCTNSGAYVPGTNQSMVVFCPGFFTASSTTWQAGSLIHEMAHALLGLQISDRAYASDRLLGPTLSTAEALDNAESHAQLAQELGTGQAPASTAPQDEIKECPPATEPLIREAVARAQRWNRDAEVVAVDPNPAMIADNAPQFTTHLGDATPATRSAARRIFSNMVTRLKSPIEVVCDTEAAPECSSRQAYKKAAVNNIGLGVGIGAAIGGGLGAIAGTAVGFGVSALAGVGVGLGLLGLGLLIGLIAGAATSTSDSLHVCPTWGSQPLDDRVESLLAGTYEMYAGLNVQQSRQHAALARALHTRYIGAPEAI